jgi:hypothetical protein
MQKQTREETLERTRKKLVVGLKSGSNLVLFMGKFAKNLTEMFGNAGFWKPEFLFNPTDVFSEDYIKKHVITEEEDVDYLGNKGNFMTKKEFVLTLLISGDYESMDTLYKELNVDKKYF